VTPEGATLPELIDRLTLHRLTGVLGRLREGWALPASERRLRGAPLPALALTAGAAGAFSAVRGKSPVACGKSSAGMSAPPLMRWQSRQ
jgi:hypothetical protein